MKIWRMWYQIDDCDDSSRSQVHICMLRNDDIMNTYFHFAISSCRLLICKHHEFDTELRKYDDQGSQHRSKTL